MTAECWDCQSSIELSESEWSRINEFLPVPQFPQRHAAERWTDTRQSPNITVTSPTSNWRTNHTADTDPLVELEELLQGTSWSRLIKQALASLPAWLVSFLLHLFLILVLAMIMLTQTNSESIQLVLSTFIDSRREPGGEVRLEDQRLPLADDTMPAPPLRDDHRALLNQAERDAAVLTVDDYPLAPLPDVNEIRRQLVQPRDARASFLARDPRLRAEIVRREGGTTMTEAAVARGLRWLASVQNKDGSWSLAGYERHSRADNRGDAAATSLALLPFLGAGQTHEQGIYKQTVARGLAWLLTNQKSNGDLRANFERPSGMYAHGQATIVLCEAFALTGDERLREPAQRGINFIQQSQHRDGGWRYQPGQAGDTSVLGWQVMALQSARASSGQIVVDEQVMTMADYFLDLAGGRSNVRNAPEGALYRYLPREGQPTASMTAEAILCRMYLGWRRDDPRMDFAVRWLLENHLPPGGEPDIYYWYYATQVMHHFGGEAWRTWNGALRDRLVDMQETKGAHPGSWNPKQFRWGAEGERIFVTSLAICTLEVYYRHLPIFRPLALD